MLRSWCLLPATGSIPSRLYFGKSEVSGELKAVLELEKKLEEKEKEFMRYGEEIEAKRSTVPWKENSTRSKKNTQLEREFARQTEEERTAG